MAAHRDRWLLPVLAWPALLLGACTFHHSRQALEYGGEPPSKDATFVSEEDSGLALPFGLFLLSEPDHYTVLLERLRKRYRCARLHHPQLDFYTDHWLILSFPIARITAVCEPEASDSAEAQRREGAAAPAPATPAAATATAAPAPSPAAAGRAPVALDEDVKARDAASGAAAVDGTAPATPAAGAAAAPALESPAAPQSP
jgi:hypothetical protein